jgi:uncharacterized protein (TIGR03437 family)
VRYLKFVCAVCCATLSAQISHFATTSDGSILYFSTGFQLIGGFRTPAQQIVRYRDDTGTFEQCVPQSVFGASGYNTAIIGVANPDVTADGSLVAWNEILACTAMDFHQCLGVPYENPIGLITPSSAFTPSAALWTGPSSYVQVSRNGQYAVSFAYPTLISLVDGVSVGIADAVYGAGQSVSDAGAVVIAGSPPTLVSGITAGQRSTVPLEFSRQPAQVRLSRDGRNLLYESVPSGSNAQLFFYDTVLNTETLIATGPMIANNASSTFPYQSFTFFPCFDDSGTTVMYVNSPSAGLTPQVYLWDVGGPPPGRQIATAPDGIGEAILSGSAQVVFAATLNNRLLRIDVASGAIRELSGRVPVVASWFSPVIGMPNQSAPGSLMQANGSGLADVEATPSVNIGGVEAFVLSGAPAQVTFQIPWDIPLPNPDCAPQALSFGVVSNPVFSGGAFLSLCSTSPFFISPAIHQDFHGAVTQQDSAAPGEILHFYMIGLGPVSPPGQTGQMASGNPLQYAEPVSCALEDSGNVAATNVVTPSFAGLAPGLIGVYQLDLPLAALRSTGVSRTVFLGCGYETHSGNTSFYVQ